jgi:hypothetical protein
MIGAYFVVTTIIRTSYLAFHLTRSGNSHTRWVLASMLFEVTPNDPLVFAGVAGLLLVVTLAACLIPAQRTMRVDPMER